MGKIDVLISMKQMLFARVQKTFDLIAKFDEEKNAKTHFLIRCEKLEETKEQYYDVVMRIDEEKMKEDPEFEAKFVTKAFDELCYHIRYHRDELLESMKSVSSSTSSAPTASTSWPRKTNVPWFKFPKILRSKNSTFQNKVYGLQKDMSFFKTPKGENPTHLLRDNSFDE